MRQIKFRAWDKENKKMLHFANENNEVDHCSEYNELTFSWDWKRDGAKEPSFGDLDMSYTEVELMQFTGLLDNHGKEIYERDIVRENTEAFGVSKLMYVVGFERGHFTLTEIGSGYDRMGIWNVNTNMEIIGNIYENPELLPTN